MTPTGTPLIIQNTDGNDWLVKREYAIDKSSTGEWVSYSVAVPRDDQSLGHLEKQAMLRAIELLTMAVQRND